MTLPDPPRTHASCVDSSVQNSGPFFFSLPLSLRETHTPYPPETGVASMCRYTFFYTRNEKSTSPACSVCQQFFLVSRSLPGLFSTHTEADKAPVQFLATEGHRSAARSCSSAVPTASRATIEREGGQQWERSTGYACSSED